jgi:hypothetical protein
MRVFAAFSLLCALAPANPAWADPDDFVLTTYADDGLRQLNLATGTINQSGHARDSHATIGLGYGVTDHWFSELYLGYDHTAGDSTVFDSFALQNIFRLTDGQWPVDIGLYTEIEYESDRSAGYQLTVGPLLQSEIGLTTLNLNLLFHRNYDADFSNPLQLGYQWQVKRRWTPTFEFGLQGFGNVGQWDRWAPRDQQSHRLGPAIFGKIALSGKQAVSYNAAVLFDEFDDAHATTLRAQLIYGF